MINPVIEALSLLTPYDIDVAKRRLGPSGDGGYVFADIITEEHSFVSYGVSTEYQLDEQLASLGHKVFMFDHTIDGINRTNENMMWFKEGVAGHSSPEQKLYTISDHILRHSMPNEKLILKMDVEGCEYDSIGSTPDAVLEKFDQAVIELHHLWKLTDNEFCQSFTKMMRKLNRFMTIFHVHANNWDGHNGISICDGVPISNLIEISLVKTSLVRRMPSQTLYPTIYDYPSTSQREKLLWFYPFLPTTAISQDFYSCSQRVELIEKINNPT